MSTSRLSLVVSGTRANENSEAVGLPLSEAGTVHIHFHAGDGEFPGQANSAPPRRSWLHLCAGVAVVAAFVGGYQTGHRPSRDDVANLRPSPVLTGSAASQLPVMPAPAGMPEIERQLATAPVIVAPPVARAAPQVELRPTIPSAPTSSAPSAAAKPGTPQASRNAFGLEN